MKNPLGIHYGCFVTDWNEDQRGLIRKVKDLGFDLLEFGAPWLVERNDADIAEFRKIAEGEGVLLAMSLGMGADLDISSTDPAVRKAGLDFLTDLAVAMAKVGANACSGIVYGAWNGKIASYEEKSRRWDLSVETMKEAVKVFASEGVIFNLEVVNRFESFLINECREALLYLGEVGSPNLGIHLDTFHMNIEEDSFSSAIAKAGGALKHFHIGENNRKFPGLGMMPWREIFDSLDAIDYRGPIAMEPFVKPGGEVGASVSLYRPMMEHADIEAGIRRSVSFVRGLMA